MNQNRIIILLSVLAILLFVLQRWFGDFDKTQQQQQPSSPSSSASLTNSVALTKHEIALQRAKQKHAEKCPRMNPLTDEVTGCPEEDLYLHRWMQLRRDKFATSNSNNNNKFVIVDVGMNKATSLNGMLKALGLPKTSRTDLALATYDFGESVNSPPPGSRNVLCDACCSCLDEVMESRDVFKTRSNKKKSKRGDAADDAAQTARRHRYTRDDVEIFGFDGLEINVKFGTHYLLEKVGLHPHQTHLTHAAVTDVVPHDPSKAFVNFPKSYFGDETQSLRHNELGLPVPMAKVRMVSLDTELPSSVEFIDVLLTDTEGNDFKVAKGAQKRFLSQGKVGLYVFELHKHRPKTPLFSSVVRDLERWGYECYLPLQALRTNPNATSASRRVVPVSGECWRDEFDELRGWHNVVCVNSRRFPELGDLFRYEFSHEPRHWQHIDCYITVIKRHLFDKFPQRNWTWALQSRQQKRRRR